MQKSFAYYLRRVVFHPFASTRFACKRASYELKLTQRGRIANRGERLVVNDWESAKKDGITAILHIHRYEWICGLLKGLRCLDAGCGSGYGTHYLADRGAGEVIGVDISDQAIRYARQRYQRTGLDFVRMDVQEMEFEDNAFDAVISFDVIEHIDAHGQERFLQEVTRVLKPGGLAVIGCPNALLSLGINPFHERELTPAEFEQLLKRYFDKVTTYSQIVSIPGLVEDHKWRERADEITYDDLA